MKRLDVPVSGTKFWMLNLPVRMIQALRIQSEENKSQRKGGRKSMKSYSAYKKPKKTRYLIKVVITLFMLSLSQTLKSADLAPFLLTPWGYWLSSMQIPEQAQDLTRKHSCVAL